MPEVVARVDGEAITAEEFRRELKYLHRMRMLRNRRAPLTRAECERLLQETVNGRVLAVLAKRSGVTVTDDEVQADFDERKRQMPSERHFREYLRNEGLDEEKLLELVRERVLAQRFTSGQTADLTVTDDEAMAEYERLKASGRTTRLKQTVDVSHILIKVPGTDEDKWAKAKETIGAARQRVLDGEEFADVAKEVSQDPVSAQRGGRFPETPAGRMDSAFDRVMFATPAGEVSEPFRTRYGWHILKVNAKHEPGPITFEQARQALIDSLMQAKRLELVNRLIEEGKSTMKIEILYPPPGS